MEEERYIATIISLTVQENVHFYTSLTSTGGSTRVNSWIVK